MRTYTKVVKNQEVN